MPEQFPSGTGLDALLPITIPELSDPANIQQAFKSFYYGDLDASSGTTTGTDLYNEPISVGGYLKKLFVDKANYTDKLSVFASTTSSELRGVISDETGTGALVFATSPTLVTPTLGVALATSINGTTIPTSKTLVTTDDTGTVTNTMLAGSIANAKLVNSTISGVSLGSDLNSLTAGTGITLSGGYNGSASKTVSIDSTVIATSSSPSDGYVISYDSTNGIVWQPVSELPGTIENATTAANATNTAITNDTSTSSSVYPTWVTANTGNLPQKVTSTKLSFVPSTGILTSTGFVGTTFNGLTLTAATTGFTIAGGTTSRTLTVGANASVSGTNTGDQTISLTGDVSATGGTGALTTTIGTGKVTNDMLAGSIANAKLSNSSVTVGTTSIALGASSTTLAGITTINSTTIPTSKTLVVTTDKINVLASTSSSELASIISDETGSGALVFANTPTLVTPVLGAATATSINGTSIPTSKTLVTTDSTATIAAPTTGNAGSATKAVAYSAASSTYPSTPANRIFVGSVAPDSGSVQIGDIWMW